MSDVMFDTRRFWIVKDKLSIAYVGFTTHSDYLEFQIKVIEFRFFIIYAETRIADLVLDLARLVILKEKKR